MVVLDAGKVLELEPIVLSSSDNWVPFDIHIDLDPRLLLSFRVLARQVDRVNEHVFGADWHAAQVEPHEV